MGVKRYIGFSLLFIILLGLFVYSLTGEKFTLDIANITITLPVAIWAVIPALLLSVATVLHLLFYGSKNALKLRKIKKDSANFTEAAKEALLGKEITKEYKSEFFKLPGAILPLLNADPLKARKYRVYDDDIQDIIDIKEAIERGEVVDLSKYNLKPNNPYVVKNELNRIKDDPKVATKILDHCDEIEDKSVCEKAFNEFIKVASLSEIRKYESRPSREVFDILIDRIGSKKNPIELSDEEIIDYLKDIDEVDRLDSDYLLSVMKRLKRKIDPDRLVRLASKFTHDFPHRSGEAYLYVMFELQRVDDAREYLANSGEDEYKKFQYMLYLKDQGRNFDPEIFV
jgi:hypothetical protein